MFERPARSLDAAQVFHLALGTEFSEMGGGTDRGAEAPHHASRTFDETLRIDVQSLQQGRNPFADQPALAGVQAASR